MRFQGGVVEIGGSRLSGFCIDRVPEDAMVLTLDLGLPDRGCLLDLDILDLTRRFIHPNMSPGHYRILVPLQSASRPVVHLSPPYRLADRYGDQPHGLLTSAYYVLSDPDMP